MMPSGTCEKGKVFLHLLRLSYHGEAYATKSFRLMVPRVPVTRIKMIFFLIHTTCVIMPKGTCDQGISLYLSMCS